LDQLEPAPAGVGTLLLVPEASEAIELAALLATREQLRPVHTASGLARTARLLKADAVRTLLATPADALQLASRSALKLASVPRVAVLWPELHLELGAVQPIDTILGECQGAQRIFCTGDDSALEDLLERHARRAPIAAAARCPETPVGRVRCAVVDRQRLALAVRAALDGLNPETALLWDPTPLAAGRWSEFAADPTLRIGADPGEDRVDLALCVELPSADALAALSEVARDVVVFARATQVAYLRRLVEHVSLLRLPTEADRARDRTAQLRSMLRDRLETEDHTADLVALAPLLDEYDAALVAAAALRVRGPGAPPADAADAIPTWVHIHINVGKRDRVRTGDVVGALLNAVGLPKDHIGRVDVRENFSLIEVRAEVAERTLRGLEGTALRGRTVAARVDRR
jgi:ATP-dependent RNA helicase DeaD